MIDRVGRRVLLWAGFGIMAAIMVLLTVTVQLKVTLFYFTPTTPGRPVKACFRNGEKHFFKGNCEFTSRNSDVVFFPPHNLEAHLTQ